MFRKIIIPTDKAHSIELPENLYGKHVEITVKEITAGKKITGNAAIKKLPARLQNNAFWNDIPFNPAFPSLDEIKHTAWPKRNW